jgi:spore maturation protein CgeB
VHIVILGLSITSSWGNGHATTYRGLARALASRGHVVTFYERDLPWYAENRDMPQPPCARTRLYESVDDLHALARGDVREADLVIVGSYVPDGVPVGDWVTRTATGVTAFYDIDTPVTLARLGRGDVDYVSRALIPRFHLYLSFTGGPTLERLEREFGARMARPLYCAVDPDVYVPGEAAARWDLGYLGTYSDDRQASLARLMLEPARSLADRQFVVAGPQYPAGIEWPANVARIAHLPPREHRAFYNAQRYTLNLTRADMIRAGWSPSVRLFEAASCGTPIVSDDWDGLEAFFTPGRDVLIARRAQDTLAILHDLPDEARRAIGRRARARVLAAHTPEHRARELERYVEEARASG